MGLVLQHTTFKLVVFKRNRVIHLLQNLNQLFLTIFIINLIHLGFTFI